ncbi:MAG: hypothetical protein KatS3mg119_1583 [Rhodothalassiaceae bacterium]|nr:MAG: hypothetical protein KatS3mg119_1583 [Rhodothalassiaceae bacterium]
MDKPANATVPAITAFLIGFINFGIVFEGTLWWIDDLLGLDETLHYVTIAIGLVGCLAFAVYAAGRARRLYRSLADGSHFQAFAVE